MAATDQAQVMGTTGNQSSLSFIRINHLVKAAIIFIVAFLPRAIYPVSDTALWHERGAVFLQALSAGDWGATWTTPHPGVTTMWLVAGVRWLGNRFTDYGSLPAIQQHQLELLPLALIIALAISLGYLLLRRIFDERVALASTLLLALDPFHLFVSKILHPDALMSVLMMVSALFLFLYMKEEKWRTIIVSGAFSGLAVLSKTPAIFMIPYFALWLGVLQLTKWQAMEPRPALSSRAFWRERLRDVLRVSMLWFAALIVVVFVAWPAMWVEPLQTISRSIGGTLYYRETAHPNPIFYLGRVTTEDPGWSYYPFTMVLKSTIVTLPLFALTLFYLISGRTERYRRTILWLMLGFVVFFTVQMSLGEKKFTRYALPAIQFVVVLAGFAGARLAGRLQPRQFLTSFALVGMIGLQAVISLPHHPYYGTHYNRLFGTPRQILEQRRFVPGQEAGEGLDQAAAYLNRHPLSPLLVVGTQLSDMYGRYFEGKTVRLTNDEVDYVIFTRNWTIRGFRHEDWGDVWERYKERRPKLVVAFDDVPYVWVYKTGPALDDAAIPNRVEASMGDTIRLLGYEVNQSTARPGDVLKVSLYWEASAKPSSDYTVFVHLIDASGELRAQRDGTPQNGMYPAYLWDAGERVLDEYELALADDLPPGTYALEVGMYTLQTLERVPIVTADGEAAPNRSLRLVNIEISP